MKKIKGINILTLVVVGLGLISLIVGLTFKTELDYPRDVPNTSISAESYREYELGWSNTKLTQLSISIDCENTVENGTLFLYIGPLDGSTGEEIAQFYEGGGSGISSYFHESCSIDTGNKIMINYEILMTGRLIPLPGPIRIIVIPADRVNFVLVQETVDVSISIDTTWELSARITGKNIFLYSGLVITLLGLGWGFLQYRKNQDITN